MTVSSSVNKVTYSGNSTTTVFPVNYYFLENSHLQVIIVSNNVETIQTITSQYTVIGAGNPSGGSVTMLTPPPTGTQLIIVRNVPATQETDYLANDPFPAESHERALDKLTMLVQQVELEADRALKIPLSSLATTSTELTPEANRLLAWNSNASAIYNFDLGDAVSVVGQQASFSNVFTGNGIAVNFTLSRSPGNVNNIDVSVNGVTQIPNVDYILSGTTLTFMTAPPAVNSKILARYSETFTINEADASNVRYVPAGTGALLTNVQDKLRQTVSVKDFGAVGNGVADDTAAIQAAIDYLETINGGIVNFEQKNYKITSTLTIQNGIMLQAQQSADISTNTNGGSGIRARIFWAGANNGTMLKLFPPVVGDVIFGGGSRFIEYDGLNLAAYGVIFDNTKFSIFNGSIRNVKTVGLTICSDSGSASNFSMKNTVENLHFIWGTDVVCQNAYGLVLRGGGASIPATQQYVQSVFGLVYNGALVSIAQTDNAQLYSVHASVQTSGTGCSLELLKTQFGGGANLTQGAVNNVIYYITGKIRIENGGIGSNRFIHINNEAGGIDDLDGGNAQYAADLLDCITGEMYTSRKYNLRGSISLKSGDFVNSSATVSRISLSLLYPTYGFVAGANSLVSAFVPPIYEMNTGKIYSVKIFVGSNGTSAGNYVFNVYLSTGKPAARVVTPLLNQTQTVAPGAQYEIKEYIFNFGGSTAQFTKNEPIYIGVQRSGTSGSDTNTDEVAFLGVSIDYVANGPTGIVGNPKNGTYFVPFWS